MVKLFETLLVIALLKGAYYDAAAGILPAVIDLCICLAVVVAEIRYNIKHAPLIFPLMFLNELFNPRANQGAFINALFCCDGVKFI